LTFIRVLYAPTLAFLHPSFTDTPPTEIHTLSLHDALPIYLRRWWERLGASQTLRIAAACHWPNPAFIGRSQMGQIAYRRLTVAGDRKSTRLNSSHVKISYAVFCLKKKNKKNIKENSSVIKR